MYEIEKNIKPVPDLWERLARNMESGDSVLVADRIEAHALQDALMKEQFTDTLIRKHEHGFRVWGFLDVDSL